MYKIWEINGVNAHPEGKDVSVSFPIIILTPLACIIPEVMGAHGF